MQFSLIYLVEKFKPEFEYFSTVGHTREPVENTEMDENS